MSALCERNGDRKLVPLVSLFDVYLYRRNVQLRIILKYTNQILLELVREVRRKIFSSVRKNHPEPFLRYVGRFFLSEKSDLSEKSE